MLKFDVQMQLEGLAEAREKWRGGRRRFEADAEKVLHRLLHEASVNYMSRQDIARRSGLTVKQINREMDKAGLNWREGRTLLAKTAAEALATNADLLGVHPSEVDLMSPLAYLPAGEELRQAVTDASVHTVTELEEDHVHTERCAVDRPCPDDGPGVSGNLMDKDALADTIQDAMIGHCGKGAYKAIAQAVLDAGWHK